jgi:hypothetical protein
MSEWKEPLLKEGIQMWAMRRAIRDGVRSASAAFNSMAQFARDAARAAAALVQAFADMRDEWVRRQRGVVVQWERAVMAFEAGAPCDVRTL